MGSAIFYSSLIYGNYLMLLGVICTFISQVYMYI